MGAAADKVIKIARAQLGYLEKKSNSNLDSKVENAGNNNYTKYARDLYPTLQGQPWCDMFVDWCFVKAFGKVDARRLLGGFSAYTPTSAQHYKDMGLWSTYPQPGDQIFFKNSVRIHHTGIVVNVKDGIVYTIEGNTSSLDGIVEPNGGGVWDKSYLRGCTSIAGYGRPKWELVEKTIYNVGWNHDSNGWWYADTKNSYLRGCWKDINHHRYYFNKDGYALTNWQKIDGKWYYFEPRAGHPLECALYTTDSQGVQDVGEF